MSGVDLRPPPPIHTLQPVDALGRQSQVGALRSGKPEQRLNLAKSTFLSKLLVEFCNFHNANNACLQTFRLF